MTIFLKYKIRQVQKEMLALQNEYVKRINKYNRLVNEYQMMNNFAPIAISQAPPQQEVASPPELPSGSDSNLPLPEPPVQQENKPGWTPEKKKAFGEKMKQKRLDKLKREADKLEV